MSRFRLWGLTWVKGTAVHVCLVSFRLTGRDVTVLPWSPLLMALCHICRPCLFFRSISARSSGFSWRSGLAGVLGALGARPGRPWDRKAGKDNLEAREGALLGAGPRLKSPDWARAWGSSCTTLTIPRTGSSGPLPDDSNSTLAPLRMWLMVLWGNVKPTTARLSKKAKLTRKAILKREKYK